MVRAEGVLECSKGVDEGVLLTYGVLMSYDPESSQANIIRHFSPWCMET